MQDRSRERGTHIDALPRVEDTQISRPSRRAPIAEFLKVRVRIGPLGERKRWQRFMATRHGTLDRLTRTNDLLRNTFSLTVLCRINKIDFSCWTAAKSWSSAAMTTSPAASPALSAGLPFETSVISIPLLTPK